MRPETFERIKDSILRQLNEAQRPVHVSSLPHVAGTDYDRAREVRRALEAQGLVYTFKDMDERHHPLMVALAKKEPVVNESIPLEDDLVIVRTKGRTYVFPCVTGTLKLNQPIPEIRPAVDPRRQIVAIPD